MIMRVAYKFYRCWHRFASWLEPQRELAGLEDAARGRKEHARVLFELFKLYVNLDLPANAERCMRRYVELYPDCAPAHAEIAHMCMRQGRHEQAVKAAERALRYDRNCWLAYAILGESELHLGNSARAVSALKQAVWLSDVDAADGRVHAMLAKAYGRLGKTELADAHRQRASELLPGDAGEGESGAHKG